MVMVEKTDMTVEMDQADKTVQVERLKTLPAADGFHMPGEFEPRSQDFLIWPERTDTWRNGGKPAQQVLVDVAKEIIKYDKLTVFCSSGQYENARARLPEAVRVVEMSALSAAAWSRASK